MTMNEPRSPDEPVTLTRDVEAAVVPMGNTVTLQKGEQARITQSLGGSHTVIVQGNMFRIAGRDADALGLDPAESLSGGNGEGDKPALETPEEVEKQVWEQLKSCYDPEIPVNIVDLGLIYDCHVTQFPQSKNYRVDIKMTLTAPGCGMGDHLKQDVEYKVTAIPGVTDARAELVWEPQWNQGMMSEAAQLQLGLL